MLAASGDQTISLWDTGVARLLNVFAGHTGSVKTLDPLPSNASVFASGARDGQLALWDARVGCQPNSYPGAGTTIKPVLTIAVRCTCFVRGIYPPLLLFCSTKQVNHCIFKILQDAHSVPQRSAGRRRTPVQGKPRLSVTSVLWLSDDRTLASGGVDGIVKLWDIRGGGSIPHSSMSPGPCSPSPLSGGNQAGKGHPLVHSYETSGYSVDYLDASALPPALCGPHQKQHGVTSLALSPDGASLLVSLTGGHLLLYDAKNPRREPGRLGGHLCHSFYVKAAFSRDGTHVASGSSDNNVCIWDLSAGWHRDAAFGKRSDCLLPQYHLAGHEGEVTAVAWCPSDSDCLVSAGDDAALRVWRRGLPSQAPEKLAINDVAECLEGGGVIDDALGTPAPQQNSTPSVNWRTPGRARAALATYFSGAAASAPHRQQPGGLHHSTPAPLTAARLAPESSENIPPYDGGSTPLPLRLTRREGAQTPCPATTGAAALSFATTGRKRARQASITAFLQSPMRPFIDLTNQIDQDPCPSSRRVTLG